jgi:hypothetical protein
VTHETHIGGLTYLLKVFKKIFSHLYRLENAKVSEID